MEKEKSPGGLVYKPDFIADARTRAVSVMLTALIHRLPDLAEYLKDVNEILDNEERRMQEVAKQLPEGPRTSSLEVINARMTEVRDEVDRVVTGRLSHRPQ